MKSLFIAKRVLFSNIPMMIVIMIMALAFSFIFGFLLSGGGAGAPTYPIAVVQGDEGEVATDFSQALIENPRLQTALVTENEARRMVGERQVLLAVLISENFSSNLLAGESPQLTLLRDEENNLYLAARQELERVLTHSRAAVTIANRVAVAENTARWESIYAETLAAWQSPPVTIALSGLGEAPEDDLPMDRAGIGMTVMFVMITVIAAAGAILDERNRGTWQRLVAAPASRISVLSGYLISYFALGVLQFTILLTVSSFVLGVSWGNLLGVAAVSAVFLLCAVSFGLLIAGFVRTFQQQQAVSALVVTATSMLGGLFWPLDMVPTVMQTMARATPQYWAMQGYEQLLYRGLDWANLQQPLLVLSGFALVFLGIGLSRIKFA